MDVDEMKRGRTIDADPAATAPDRSARVSGRDRAFRWTLRLAVLAVVAAAGVWAYRANVTGRPAMEMTMRVSAGAAAFPVTVVPVERGRITGAVTYTGSVAPLNEEDVYPRVTGRIVELPVYPGDAVRAGQVVARLDDAELGSRVGEAAAGVAAAEASLAQMDADVLAARHGVAQMEREVAMAAADVAAAQQGVAQMEGELAMATADAAGAQQGVAQMESELAMATADVAAARDGVAQMEREVAMSEAEASYHEPHLAREERLFQSGAVSQQDLESLRSTAVAARARVQAARARTDQARAMVLSAQAKADAARARAGQARAMVVSAGAKAEAARARLDQARAMVASARAKADAARARAEQASAMEASALRKRDAMAAMAAQSRAQLRTAEVVRGYVTIVSPAGGYVVKRLVAPGVLVQPGMAILKIAQIDRVRLQANVGERDLASIRLGSPVAVTTTAAAEPPVAARVTAVFPFVDQGPRTAVVEAIVDNAGRRFLPGQYVSMRFVTGERDGALAVPRTAVVRMGGKTTVWVLDGDRAQPREVTTGLDNPERVEIVTGLAGPERVVARGHEGLYAGARVVDAAAPGAAPAPDAHRGMPGMGKDTPAGPSGRGEASSAIPAPTKEAPHGTGH
jgi:RND family efflux transporter MFP subunit